MDTHFAPAEREDSAAVARDVEFVSQNTVISGLLRVASGLLAVLTESRQIIALNDSFLKTLGIRDPGTVLGLRPGEAIGCVHAHDMPGGCGTSRLCATCGAAIAIVTTLANDQPEERKCIVAVEKDGKSTDLCLRVRACTVNFEGRRYILLFLQDITSAQRWASLERVFFHDISNAIMALRGASERLDRVETKDKSRWSNTVKVMAERLSDEVRVQRALLQTELSDYQLAVREVPLENVVQAMLQLFASHPAAKDKVLRVPASLPSRTVTTDPYLLMRVLSNMLTNAFEATAAGGEVKLSIEARERSIAFCVWNSTVIPQDLAQRVFQKNFSTKGDYGRGLGTYGMKLLGEHFLGGKVDFTSFEPEGTIFRLVLPA